MKKGYTAKEFIQAVKKSDKNQVILFDESLTAKELPYGKSRISLEMAKYIENWKRKEPKENVKGEK